MTKISANKEVDITETEYLIGIDRKKLIAATAIVWMLMQIGVVLVRSFTLGIDKISPLTPFSLSITFLLYFLLKKDYVESVIASLLLLNISAVVVFFCYISGGFKGPVIYTLIAFPVLAFLLINHFAGWIVFTLVISVFGVFAYANFYDLLPNSPPFSENAIHVARAIAVTIVAFLLSWIGWYYSSLHNSFSQSISEKNQQLILASKHKSDFISNMSHELRTPLNAIIGFSNRLLKKTKCEDERTRIALDSIHRSGQHLLTLVNDVLDMAKIDEGKLTMNFEVADIVDITQSAIDDTKVLADEKQLSISFENTTNTKRIDIKMDTKRMRQILTNLLSNAIKYTNQGNINVTLSQRESMISIGVQDTGCGIPKENIQDLFEKFKRLKQHENSNIAGSGLGLVIVSELVELHHGTIDVESEEGVGSTFTVSFPVTDKN